MSDESWLSQSRKKRNKNRWTLVLILAVLVAAGIFLKNNHELLWSSKGPDKSDVNTESPVFSIKDTVKPEAGSQKAAVAAPLVSNHAPLVEKKVEPNAETKPEVKAELKALKKGTDLPLPGKDTAKPGAETFRAPQKSSVLLSDIRCFLRDRKGPGLVLSLDLVFDENRQLKQELLVKKDMLKVMIKKTVSEKNIDDMKADSLRFKIKKSLNTLLENGKIIDIEIKELRIDKVE
jgi:flagellar basal body-associated protein FliL